MNRRVGVDLDGVCYDFRQALSEFLIKNGLIHCTVESVAPTWDFYDGWQMSLADFLAHFKAGVDAGQIFRLGEPLPGSVDATLRLHEAGFQVNIVTDRLVGTTPGASQRATAAWLADHGFYFDSITFTADKTSVPSDFFIEDRLQNYDALVAAGVDAYLVDRPWNQDDGSRKRLASIGEFASTMIGKK